LASPGWTQRTDLASPPHASSVLSSAKRLDQLGHPPPLPGLAQTIVLQGIRWCRRTSCRTRTVLEDDQTSHGESATAERGPSRAADSPLGCKDQGNLGKRPRFFGSERFWMAFAIQSRYPLP